MAYIYVYELLNGIGAASPEDALEKLLAFQTGFVESGVGEASMGKNLRQWMLEFAVLHNLPPQTARSFASPQVLRRDEALVTLRSPQEATDQAVLEALCAFGPKKLEESPVVKKEGARGVHLFAEVWRQGLALSAQKGEDLFTACFGRLDSYPWSPLSNAVYWEERPHPTPTMRWTPAASTAAGAATGRRSAMRTSTLARTSCRACSTRRTACCANT